VRNAVYIIYYTPLTMFVWTDRFRSDEIRVAFPPKSLIFTTGQGRVRPEVHPENSTREIKRGTKHERCTTESL